RHQYTRRTKNAILWLCDRALVLVFIHIVVISALLGGCRCFSRQPGHYVWRNTVVALSYPVRSTKNVIVCDLPIGDKEDAACQIIVPQFIVGNNSPFSSLANEWNLKHQSPGASEYGVCIGFGAIWTRIIKLK